MNLHSVLENWSDYETKKQLVSTDVTMFSCEEWEINYLREKIKTTFPFINELYIIGAIRNCCQDDPVPRQEFVRRVLKKLQMVH